MYKAQNIIKFIVLPLAIIAQVHFAYAQSTQAGVIPNGKATFLDQNGKPLSSGNVYFYIPNTTTPKTTYQDINQTVANTNPVVLDAAGRALLWGTGNYRQLVKDKNGNTIWDATTSISGSGSGSNITSGDGDLVGTIKPWAGMTAPSQYMFTYGQEVSRTTYSALYTAITSSQTVSCSSGSATLSGVGNTTNFWVGMTIEIPCVVSGVTTVSAKTASTITMATTANANGSVTAIFYPWGNGNGTTTFNLPDFRGLIPVGNNIMGGTSSTHISDTYFGTTLPESSGAQGGSSNGGSVTLVTGNLPAYTPAGTIANGAITFPSSGTNSAANGGTAAIATNTVNASNQNLTTALNPSQATSTFTGTAQGGTSTPFGILPPLKTVNFIIKVTPDSTGLVAANPVTCSSIYNWVNTIIGGNATCTGIDGAQAQGSRSSIGMNIDSATSTGDANYTILSTDRTVYHTNLTTARTDTMPLASKVNAGQILYIPDLAGVATATNTVTLTRSGGDTINGSTSFVALASARAMSACISDGISRWNCQQFSGGTSSGTVTNVGSGAGLTGGPITTSGSLAIDYTANNTWTGNNIFKNGAPWIDVTAYGAKCDGSTHDEVAFQNALNAATTASVPLRIPALNSAGTGPANCVLNNNITNSTSFANIIIIGASGSLSKITFLSIFGFQFTGQAQYLNLQNFDIECGATVCLSIANATEGAANSYISNLTINGGGTNGAVFFQNMSQTQFVHNRIVTNTASAYGLYIDNSQTSDAGGDLIQSNIIININGSPGTASINLVNVGGVRVLDNATSGYVYGIFNSMTIAGGSTGIQENDNQLDNLTNGIWFQPSGSGITSGNYSHVSVVGNVIHATATSSIGINVTTSGAGAFIQDLAITGNTISTKAGNAGIAIKGATNYTIGPNAIADQSTAVGQAVQTATPGSSCFIIGVTIFNWAAAHLINNASCATSGATN